MKQLLIIWISVLLKNVDLYYFKVPVPPILPYIHNSMYYSHRPPNWQRVTYPCVMEMYPFSDYCTFIIPPTIPIFNESSTQNPKTSIEDDFPISNEIEIDEVWKCYTIQVNLKNEYGLLKSLKHYEGIYEISSTINGKPSWISTSNHKAIWFINKKNYWLMGKLNRIGNDFAEIFAKSNKYSGPFNTNNLWQYFNNGWKVAKKGDINVQCITKAETISSKWYIRPFPIIPAFPPYWLVSIFKFNSSSSNTDLNNSAGVITTTSGMNDEISGLKPVISTRNSFTDSTIKTSTNSTSTKSADAIITISGINNTTVDIEPAISTTTSTIKSPIINTSVTTRNNSSTTTTETSCQDLKTICFGCAGGLGLSYLGSSSLGKALISDKKSCISCIERLVMSILDEKLANNFLTDEKWAIVNEKINNPPTVKISLPSVQVYDILSREIPYMKSNYLNSDEYPNQQSTEQPFEMLNEQIIEHKLEHSPEMPIGQSEEQITEQLTEQPTEQPAEQPTEQSVVQMVEQTNEQAIEEATEQPSELTTVDNEFESRSGGALDTLAKISGGIEAAKAKSKTDFLKYLMQIDSTFLSKIWCTEENYACQIGSSMIVSILKSIGIEIDEQVETDFELQCMP